jgi:predicted dehydrogenase
MGYYFLADFGNNESNKNETMAVFRSGSARGRGPRSIEVFGNNGSLVLEDNQLLGCPLDKQEFEPIYLPVNSSDLASNQLELLNYLWTEMVEDFIRSIRQVETSVPTFYDGLKGQQVIDAVRLSDRENKWIQLT